MPNNNPRPPKRSWRGERTASARPSVGQPAWKAERKAAPGPRVSRGVKLFAALALFLLVAGGAVAVYFWLRPPDPFRLVLVGAAYDQDLAVPSNALGRRDLDGLEQWAKDYNDKPFGREKGKNVEVRRQAVEEGNDPVAEAVANTNAPTVVVFLTGDGGGDEQGAYVLPENAGPRNLDAAYRIDKAIDDFKKLDAKTHKLLILDASSNGPDWTMRQLHNDFVRSVKKQEARIKEVPNLVVLCACNEGQQSWGSEEFGQTAFAHFVIEGLKGAADKKWDDAEDLADCNLNDGRITALELTRYVQFEVERWARRNRGADQKPLLLGDEKVAADMELGGADADYKEPAASALAEWSPPGELLQAWKDHDDLANGSPPPAAYTPAPWRQYEAALLRYEQLLRADPSGTAASTLRQKIDKLHDQIGAARRLDRDSMAGSLAAPAAFGWSPPPDDFVLLKTDFDRLWRDKTATPDQFKGLLADAPKLPDAPTQTAERLAERLTRLHLIGLLLDKAPTSRDDYQRVCDVLPKAAESPAPTEANFAVTAHASEKHLPGGAVTSWEHLKQALALRRSAETAALGLGAGPSDLPAYSEETAPWIKSAVEKADGQRRLGEDLLFASMKEGDAGRQALTAAESDPNFGYKAVRDRALAVRQAIRARDKALAELPWYTQWLGRRPLSKDAERQLTELWGKVHDLCDQLEKPDDAKAAALADATDAVNSGTQTLHTQFQAACGDKDKQWTKLQDNLRTIEDLLTVPLIEPDVRMNLLRNARKIGLALNLEATDAAAQKEESAADAASRAKALAFQQGRLAVAELGKDDADGKRAADLLQRTDEQVWQDDLDTAGDDIGRGFQLLARNAADAADKARKAPIAEAAASLRQAALAMRFLDAGEADVVLATVDPTAENRRVQLHDLLVWQAERTYRDYWASDDPANPYYRAAGLVCTLDARDLVAGAAAQDLKDEEKEARLAEVKRVETLLRNPDDFAFRWLDGRDWKTDADKVHVTDVYNIQFQYGLIGPKGAPAGRPVVWAAPGPKLVAAQNAGQPRPLERVADKPEDASVTYAVAPQRPAEGPPPADAQSLPPAREATDFAVNGLFRGRFRSLDTPVILHNQPDLVSYQPKEEKTGLIAVQADAADLKAFAARNGELVVVVDYSYSMYLNHVPPDDATKPRRIEKALEALDKCLQELPPGVRLSVLTFSAHNDADPTNNADIRVQRESREWSPDQRLALMAQLHALTPQGYTPLVHSIGEAADQFRSNAPAKTILVLTDGGDNEMGQGQEVKQRERIMKTYLHSKFDGRGIQVHVIGFRLEDLLNKKSLTEEEQLEADGYKAFGPAVEDIGGTFEDVESADKLAAKLQEYFLQVRFWVEYDTGDPVDAAAREGMQVTATNKNIRPTIHVPAPADYHVLIEALRNESRAGHNLPDQHVHVDPGEVLVLDLRQTSKPNQPFELRRDVYARSRVLQLSQPVMAPIPVGNDWLLTVLGNSPAPNRLTRNARDLTLSVERTDDHVAEEGTVRQGRPTFAWFNVLPEGGTAPVSGLRFYPRPNYPAPVWRLSLADYAPQPAAAPVVDAWWVEHDLPQDAVTVLSQGPGKDYMLPSDLNGKSITVRPTPDDPPSPLVVESVGVERRYVEEKPGQWTPDVDCLVVRLRYPPGKPYIVQLPDDLMKTESGQQAGHEHRIYTEANKYTGIFYGVGAAQLQKLTRLKLISVEGVKVKAVHPAPTAVHGEGQPPDPIK